MFPAFPKSICTTGSHSWVGAVPAHVAKHLQSQRAWGHSSGGCWVMDTPCHASAIHPQIPRSGTPAWVCLGLIPVGSPAQPCSLLLAATRPFPPPPMSAPAPHPLHRAGCGWSTMHSQRGAVSSTWWPSLPAALAPCSLWDSLLHFGGLQTTPLSQTLQAPTSYFRGISRPSSP